MHKCGMWYVCRGQIKDDFQESSLLHPVGPGIELRHIGLAEVLYLLSHLAGLCFVFLETGSHSS